MRERGEDKRGVCAFLRVRVRVRVWWNSRCKKHQGAETCFLPLGCHLARRPESVVFSPVADSPEGLDCSAAGYSVWAREGRCTFVCVGERRGESEERCISRGASVEVHQ